MRKISLLVFVSLFIFFNIIYSVKPKETLAVAGDLKVTSPTISDPTVSNPTFTGNIALPGSGKWDSSGNLGIGTTAPAGRMEILNSSGGYSSANYLQITGATANNSNYPGISFKGGTLATTYPIIALNNGGYGFYLQAGSSAGAPNAANLTFDTTQGTLFGFGATTYMKLTTAGNLGIGTTGPDRVLDVLAAASPQVRLTQADGTVYSDFQVDSSGNLTIDGTGTKLVIADDLQITGNNILDSGAVSRISLGATTTLTNTTLTLSGTSTITASSLATLTTSASLAMSSTSTLTLASNATINGGSAANDDLTLQGTSSGTRTTSYVVLQPTAGNVGIGNTAPGYTLDVTGTGKYSGTLYGAGQLVVDSTSTFRGNIEDDGGNLTLNDSTDITGTLSTTGTVSSTATITSGAFAAFASTSPLASYMPTSGTSAGQLYLGNSSGATNTWQISNRDGSSNALTFYFFTGGGPGWSGQLMSLSTAGALSAASTVTGTTINGTTGINTGAGAGTLRINSSGALSNITSINMSGSVTASGTANSFGLGSANATTICRNGNILTSCSSSKKFKNNIEYLTPSEINHLSDQILNMKISRFEYNSEKGKNLKHLGILAEDAPSELQYPDTLNGESFTNLDFFSQWAYTYAGIKVLNEKVRTADDKIHAQQKQLDSQQKQIDELKKEIESIKKK